jgi:hypothetical protein
VLVLAAACGGESRRASGGTGSGGTTGGTGGITGGTGGTAGTPIVGCPDRPPAAYAATCPTNLPAEGCPYQLECQSGATEFTYRCTSGLWGPEETACENPQDFCTGGDAQMQCWGGTWRLLGTGGDGPADCAEERPVTGTACSYSIFQGPPRCGYPCPDGSGWTVGTCAVPVWLYDGACEGDCSARDRALVDYSSSHRACNTTDDCRYLYSTCAFSRSHCSGAFILGLSADEDEFAALDAELTICAMEPDSGWSCAQCDALPPALECREGTCVTAP